MMMTIMVIHDDSNDNKDVNYNDNDTDERDDGNDNQWEIANVYNKQRCGDERNISVNRWYENPINNSNTLVI